MNAAFFIGGNMNWKMIFAWIWKGLKYLLDWYVSTKANVKVGMPSNNKEIGLRYIMQFVGRWYSWGGNGPVKFDCSGLCVEYLKAIGKLPRKIDLSADKIFKRFEHAQVSTPTRGCLVFWENNYETKVHVEIMLNDQLSIGASGGNENTKTVDDAIRDNAFIKVRPISTRPGKTTFIDPTLIN